MPSVQQQISFSSALYVMRIKTREDCSRAKLTRRLIQFDNFFNIDENELNYRFEVKKNKNQNDGNE